MAKTDLYFADHPEMIPNFPCQLPAKDEENGTFPNTCMKNNF